MKTTIYILILIACLPLSGCGLLAVPYRVTVPHESFRTIQVADSETRKPIAGARVICQMYEHKNWYPPGAFTNGKPEVGLSDQEKNLFVKELPYQKVWTWQGYEKEPGVYVLDQKAKTGWTQIFFPLPSPLGWFLYRTYAGNVTVSALGYDTVWISGVHGPNGELSGKTEFIGSRDDRLSVLLPRTNRKEAASP